MLLNMVKSNRLRAAKRITQRFKLDDILDACETFRRTVRHARRQTDHQGLGCTRMAHTWQKEGGTQ